LAMIFFFFWTGEILYSHSFLNGNTYPGHVNPLPLRVEPGSLGCNLAALASWSRLQQQTTSTQLHHPVRFAGLLWLKVLFAGLLWEKNTAGWLLILLISPNEQGGSGWNTKLDYIDL
jgi:hypothetical protein